MASATVTVRTDPDVKSRAKELFESMGLDMTTAINLFLRQSLNDNGLPFRITRESPASAAARRQALEREGTAFSSVDDLMEDLLDA